MKNDLLQRQTIIEETKSEGAARRQKVHQQLLVLCSAAAILIALAVSASIAVSSPLVPIVRWFPTTNLPQAVASKNAVVQGNSVYLIGGKTADGQATKAVYRGSVAKNGSISFWTATTELPEPLYLHASVATDEHIYVIGGWEPTSAELGFAHAEVWRAPIRSDESLGDWQRLRDRDYPLAISVHDAVLVNERIYVFGGWFSQGAVQNSLDQVYSAQIQSNGISAWQPATPLPRGLHRMSVVAYGDYVYVTGGYNYGDDQVSAAVYMAKVNANGTLGAWQTTTALPSPRYYHEVIIHDDRMVILGGFDRIREFNEVWSTEILPNGQLGTWEAELALPKALQRFGAVSLQREGSDFIYVLGGLNNNSQYHSSVYHSDVPPTPTPTPTHTPTPLPAVTLLSLDSQPDEWIPPGGEITYFIRYQTNSSGPVSNVVINNRIPEHVELIVEEDRSYDYTGLNPGDTVFWPLGDLGANEEGVVSYRVRRPDIIHPSIPFAVDIVKSGPTQATAGEEIEYTLTITSNAGTWTDVVVQDEIPIGATYVHGGDGPPTNGIVTWTLGELADNSVREVSYVVTSQTTLVNSKYRVTFSGSETKGRAVVITDVDGTPPPVNGDGVIIQNNNATITWSYGGQTETAESNPVRNPSTIAELFMPLVMR